MRKLALFILLFSLILACSDSTLASELRVVATVPENGAIDVDQSLTEIVVVFSGAVKQNSWSFVTTGKGEIPEITSGPYFTDDRTCVLPVILKPGTDYSIGINSSAKKGFKSAIDERISVTPYVLTFSTGRSKARKNRDEVRSTGQPESKGDKIPQTMVFQRVAEPRERAFSLLVPKGWQVEGGIFRVDPTAQGGPAQSIAAKLDFAVKKDREGTVMIRWLPDVLYYDASMSPAGQMGLLPPGSNYQGMTVCPLMSAQQFLTQVVFPYAHPQASGVEVIEQRSLPKVAQKYQQRVQALMPQATFSYDAALLTVAYQEGGVSYREKVMAVIENWGQLGAGMWGNKETFFLRTPVKEFSQWEPTFSVIQNSVMINQQWIAGEIRGQIERGKIVLRTQQEIQRIEREMVEHRQKTNAEIHNDMFLTLTDQEEYVNPYTNKVEMGSNQWQHRWVSESGDVIYSSDESYDPNRDVNLNRSDFKRTPVRKRFPQ